MTSESILLVGAGGHARVCIDVIEQEGRFRIGGLVGLPHEAGNDMFGYPILGVDADIPSLRRQYGVALVTVGQIKTPAPRERIYRLLEENGFELPLIVSPRAYVSPHATLGGGTVVMHGAVVNAGAVVGHNCIINSQALVEHDVVIKDHCHISTAAAVNSGVSIGSGTFVGSNSCVRQGVRIGERCLIGMGQRVLEDCEAGRWIPTPKGKS